MPQFPVLRSGAVTQYPAQKGFAFRTDVARFVDGKEQRSRAFAQPLRRWVVRLDLVDEGELNEVDLFFLEQEGSIGEFSFTDPWDGTVYASCSLDSDVFALALDGPGKGHARIVIKENRT